MTRRVLPWWGWALIGWGAAAAAAAPLIGRRLRRQQPPPPRSVGLALTELADANLRTIGRLIADAAPPDVSPDVSLPGAILGLAYSSDEVTARYWLAQCARRGADWSTQRQLWDEWQRQHTPTTLHSDPTDPEEPTP